MIEASNRRFDDFEAEDAAEEALRISRMKSYCICTAAPGTATLHVYVPWQDRIIAIGFERTSYETLLDDVEEVYALDAFQADTYEDLCEHARQIFGPDICATP